MTTDDLHGGPAITTIRVCDLNQLERDLAAARAEVARLREAVEAAFRAGFAAGADAKGMAVSWHWAAAKARLT